MPPRERVAGQREIPHFLFSISRQACLLRSILFFQVGGDRAMACSSMLVRVFDKGRADSNAELESSAFGWGLTKFKQTKGALCEPQRLSGSEGFATGGRHP